jgi:hypothetical protein
VCEIVEALPTTVQQLKKALSHQCTKAWLKAKKHTLPLTNFQQLLDILHPPEPPAPAYATDEDGETAEFQAGKKAVDDWRALMKLRKAPPAPPPPRPTLATAFVSETAQDGYEYHREQKREEHRRRHQLVVRTYALLKGDLKRWGDLNKMPPAELEKTHELIACALHSRDKAPRSSTSTWTRQ